MILRASPSPATTRVRCPSSASSNCGCMARKGTCDVAIPATISAIMGPSSSVTVLEAKNGGMGKWENIFLLLPLTRSPTHLFIHRRDIGAHILAHGHGIDQQEERIGAHIVQLAHLPAFD